MRIDSSGIRPRAERHTFKQKVEVRTGDGFRVEAESRDLSLSGMALSLSAPVIENGAFVELHNESLGTVTATVARTYDGGAAVQFSELLDALPDDQAETPGEKLDAKA